MYEGRRRPSSPPVVCVCMYLLIAQGLCVEVDGGLVAFADVQGDILRVEGFQHAAFYCVLLCVFVSE